MVKRYFIIPVFLTLMLILACSGNLLEPSIMGNSQAPALSQADNNHVLMGFNWIAIDTLDGSATIIPARSSNLHLNVTGILNSTMGVSAKSVPSQADPPNGLFVFDITLKHPFATKKQLSGFDVKGILMTPGTKVVSDFTFAGVDETALENADGFSRWWNPVEFTQAGMFGYIKGKLASGATSALTATVNPYKLFCDRLQAEDSIALAAAEPMNNDKGRAVFRAGSSNTRRYKIRFKMAPGPQVIYGYAVDCSWVAPTPNPPVNVPDDFPINANQPEAYWVNVKTVFNTLYRTPDNYTGGAVRFTADIYDWQGQKNGDFTDQFNDIVFYSPNLITGGQKASFVLQSATKATYQFDADGLNPSVGKSQFFCGAETSGLTYDQGAPPAPAGTLTSWQVATINVPVIDCAADSNNSISEAVALVNNQTSIDSLCGGTDNADYYKFTVPLGYKFGGKIEMHCDLLGSEVTLYTEDGTEVYNDDISDYLTIDQNTVSFTSGTYYLKIECGTNSHAGLYVIYPQLQLSKFTVSSSTEVTPPWLSLDADWLEYRNNILYLANSKFLWAYDVTDNDAPVFLSRLAVENNGTPAFEYPDLYYFTTEGAGDKMKKVDYTDPANPVESELLTTSVSIDCFTVDAGHVYIAFTNAIGSTVNICTDTFPSEILGQCALIGSPVKSMALVMEGTTKKSLITISSTITTAYNVYDPATPVKKDQINNVGAVNGYLTAHSPYIIKTIHNTIQDKYMAQVYEYSAGQTIDFKDSIVLDETPSCLDAYDDYFIVGDGSSSNHYISVYNYSDPANIDYNGALFCRSKAISISHDLNRMYVMQIDDDPTRFNILGPSFPVAADQRFDHVNYPTGSVVSGKYLFVGYHSDEADGLMSVDISDPPNAFGSSKDPNNAPLALFTGNAKDFSYSRIGDQINFTHPSSLGYMDGFASFNLPNDVTGIGVTNQYVYVSMETTPALKVFFIGNFPSTEPQELADASTVAGLKHLTAAGTALYGFDSTTMYIIDISDPDAPVYSGDTYPVTSVSDTLVYGDWLFLVLDHNLWVMDITDPLNPGFETAVGLYNYNNANISRLEQYLFISPPDKHPEMVDITDPSSPIAGVFPLGSGDAEYTIRDLNVSAGYLYELCDSIGVRIFELQ
jgi:hypothetical protein